MTHPVLDAGAAHRAVHAAGALVGLGCLVVAGWTLGGGWWAVAAVGVLGIASGRLGAVVQAVATVALAGGAVAADQQWLVPVLVVGVVATVEAGADRKAVRLRGELPSPANPPVGCHFNPRCAKAWQECRNGYPEARAVSPTHSVRCFLYKENFKETAETQSPQRNGNQ